MPENKALWLHAKRAPLTVGPAPYTTPRADEIVVRVRAVAVNPIDRLQQTTGDIITPWTSYPFVVGSDVAGEVVEVGSSVIRFHVGNRVLGYAAGSDKRRNRAAEGAFQDYVGDCAGLDERDPLVGRPDRCEPRGLPSRNGLGHYFKRPVIHSRERLGLGAGIGPVEVASEPLADLHRPQRRLPLRFDHSDGHERAPDGD